MSQVLVRSRRGAVAAILLCLALVSGIWTDHARAATAAKPQRTMLGLTNGDRADYDRAALAIDLQLSRYATKHSAQMAEKGYLFHTADLAGKLKGRDWTMGGENVGVGSSLTNVERAFMGSKIHRKNVLQKGYDHAAIGVVESDGKVWVTVIFYG